MATSYPAGLPPKTPLPDSDDVVRYCSPSRYDHKNNRPKVGAFIAEGRPPELSVNHLQHYKGLSKPTAMAHVRAEVDGYLTLKPKGRFVMFNVAAIKNKARRRSADLTVIYTPESDRPSHSSIYVHLDEDVTRVATMLMRLTTRANTCPAVI